MARFNPHRNLRFPCLPLFQNQVCITCRRIGLLRIRFEQKWSQARFALCVETGSNIDLELRKLYRVRNDKRSLSEGFIRIIDESGEDYLYPTPFFLPVRLSARAAKVFRRLA